MRAGFAAHVAVHHCGDAGPIEAEDTGRTPFWQNVARRAIAQGRCAP